MLELIILFVFASILLICVIADVYIIIPLLLGFFLFFFYGIYKRHSFREMFKMALSGISTVHNILLIFILIGVLTGTWRSGGTIAYIVYYAVQICSPNDLVLVSFLLTSAVSFLTGTSFGTAATVGTICMAVANSLGISPVLCGGAVLSGCYFGDRCSPMSTSALLICDLTKTDIYKNIRQMVITSIVPFAAACLIYLVAGISGSSGEVDLKIAEVLRSSYRFHLINIVPAAVILIMSFMRINVKKTMLVSIVTAALISVFVQSVSLPDLFKIALLGYHPDNLTLSGMLSGGGIVSMAKVFCIVCISSSFSGMFRGTGFLDNVKDSLERLGKRFSSYGVVLITSVLTSMIGCSQALSIMLTFQLCENVENDRQKMAIHIENTAVLIAALIPWSIACSLPLSAIGAPVSSIVFSCYLYLVPLWNLIHGNCGKQA